MNFIITNWASILVVVAFAAVIAVLAVRGKKKIIYQMIYNLILEAEKQHGSGTGPIKFAEVMTRIYTMLPAIVKVFITYDTLTKWIEDVFENVKNTLAEQAGVDQ